ncbi:PDZ domain-containing protein [Durusdinium trenchii]|uniref:PDZ domain-containing protein n=1 Tax=Durusdinium trenchii TaxID=1381693 RepID=A0ABP0LZS6_9DINO
MEGVEEVPQNRRREAAEKLQRALLKAKFLGWETKQLKVRRLNPDYSECRRPKVWAIFAFLVTVAAMVLFLLAAVLILFFFLNLKSHLIYVWGDCLRQGCNNPVQVHGMKGFFADISADIGLALVFVVLLGEVCKVLALHLAKLWNFKYMRQRQYLQAMLSLGIEVLAKDVLPDVREVCSGYVDYQNLVLYCAPKTFLDSKLGCSQAFIVDLYLFERQPSDGSGPFVDMIPAVLAPLIANPAMGHNPNALGESDGGNSSWSVAAAFLETRISSIAIVTAFTVFWYLGLSLVTFNNQLHTWNLPELLLTWLGSGLLGLMLVSTLLAFDFLALLGHCRLCRFLQVLVFFFWTCVVHSRYSGQYVLLYAHITFLFAFNRLSLLSPT